MNNWTQRVILAALTLASSAVLAQGSDEARRQAEQERLAAAQQRLEAAAREVAELSQSIAGDVLVLDGGEFSLSSRPLLGVTLDAERRGVFVNGERVDADEVTAEGVLVSQVNRRSGAGAAGIEPGDRLLSVDGVSLITESAGRGVPIALIGDALADRKPGDTVTVEILRGGKRLSKQVALSEGAVVPGIRSFRFDGPGTGALLGEEQVAALEAAMEHAQEVRTFVFESGRLGDRGFGAGRRWSDMELVELTPTLGAYFGADAGLLVVRAPTDATIGFKDGDVIRAIGERIPETVGHAMRILRSYAPGESFDVHILRASQQRTLNVTLPE